MATEVKQRNNRVFVLVGAVVAVAAFLAVIFISRGNSSSSSSGGPTTNVIVAKAPLPKGHQLAAADLTTAAYPSDKVAQNWYLDSTPLVGQFVSADVPQNAPITQGEVVATQSTASAATVAPLDISKGFVALAIPTLGSSQNVGNNIHAEDHIDVLIDAGNGTIRYAFQDLRVLQAPGGTSSVYIVELPRAQAEQLAFLTSGAAPQKVVSYVLRPVAEYGKKGQWPSNYEADGNPAVPQPADQPVNAASFNSLFPASR